MSDIPCHPHHLCSRRSQDRSKQLHPLGPRGFGPQGGRQALQRCRAAQPRRRVDAVAAVAAVSVARQRAARALGALGPRTGGCHVSLTVGPSY